MSIPEIKKHVLLYSYQLFSELKCSIQPGLGAVFPRSYTCNIYYGEPAKQDCRAKTNSLAPLYAKDAWPGTSGPLVGIQNSIEDTCV